MEELRIGGKLRLPPVALRRARSALSLNTMPFPRAELVFFGQRGKKNASQSTAEELEFERRNSADGSGERLEGNVWK